MVSHNPFQRQLIEDLLTVHEVRKVTWKINESLIMPLGLLAPIVSTTFEGIFCNLSFGRNRISAEEIDHAPSMLLLNFN